MNESWRLKFMCKVIKVGKRNEKELNYLHSFLLYRSGFRTDEQNGENVKSCVHLEPYPQGMEWFTRGFTKSLFPRILRTR